QRQWIAFRDLVMPSERGEPRRVPPSSSDTPRLAGSCRGTSNTRMPYSRESEAEGKSCPRAERSEMRVLPPYPKKSGAVEPDRVPSRPRGLDSRAERERRSRKRASLPLRVAASETRESRRAR